MTTLDEAESRLLQLAAELRNLSLDLRRAVWRAGKRAAALADRADDAATAAGEMGGRLARLPADSRDGYRPSPEALE